ncbi:MAG TPA: hypothetical protein VL326_16965 [Kofleriaceae bacterium]|jgi:hypothetical protein|nr:hypothetical protein [Kofleriaceae bacterium]
MKRTGETTAGASVVVGVLAAIFKLGFPCALILGLIVGTTMAIISLNRR